MDPQDADDPPLRYEVLGPLRIRRGGTECDAGPAMQQAVLAVLLLNANEPVSRERLVQAVWGHRATANSPALLATYVARLRQVLEPGRARRVLDGVLSSWSGGYRLSVGSDCLDLQVFERARSRAREQRAAGDLAGCAATLDRALGLWCGGGLDGLPGPYAALHRGRLAELRLATEEERFELALLLGRQHEVVAELAVLASGHPHRERLRALLMLALYRAGRRSEALAVYVETRRLSITGLGLEPGRELAELHQRMLRSDSTLELAAVDGRRAGVLRSAWRPAQLPSDLSDFTGRSAALRALGRILLPGSEPGAPRRAAAVAVAVVSGPPGIGKTVLAVRAAHRLQHHYPDGQLYAALHGPDGRPRAAIELLGRFLIDLGVEPADLPGELEQRAALFRSVSAGRRLLLVLDDAEGEAQVSALLPGSPSCAVLVTARARLAELPGARPVVLDRLAPAEALRLLRRLVDAVGERPVGQQAAEQGAAEQGAAERVLAACDGLPLALRAVAVRLAARPGGGLAPLADRLADEERRLLELSPGGRGVSAAFASCGERLRRAPDGPAGWEAFRRLSLAGATECTAQAAADLLGLGEQRAEHLLDLLAQYGLLRRTAVGGYRADPLAALFGRSPGWTPDGIRMAPDSPRWSGRPD
ncbi:DNA-binding SARP family transcriptional activator [Kitasatospora sp. MAP12-15]|uniref:AfsR/SARP family transcriptional regulator n=1 Tax=unclassified Kitasatospora TaxID=2633591 RepID=UPI002473465A|nr:AfsR/SARP family transcriptional regulator [Kitasatospora sp. MAP12-44]MDH6112709.1 DNA-binding SARP family transcriptional activator [Kitasatospora sp. MAP12-44]